ncbi:Diaminopimelate epimerase-like protein [Paxillus ammoniavirescens]|nr:Diaminopimelate epimerase-like protein [Paxillus ammoniavirescens]
MPTFPYVVVNAFTRSPLGGNPAVIVPLPPGSLAPNTSTPVLDNSTMISLSKSFAQPIIVFVAAPSPDVDDGILDIRFFAHDYAPLICGHGMFATTKALCRGSLPGMKRTHAGEETVVRFRTATGTIVSAQAVPSPSSPANKEDENDDGEFYAIELPTNAIEEVTGEDKDRVHNIIAKALRRDSSTLGLKFVGRGTGKVKGYLMVVLDEDEELEGRDIHIPALLETEPLIGPFGVIVLTHLTPDRDHPFVSRVFVRNNGFMEDNVCGSAHTLTVPYYASLPKSRVKAGQEVYVRQVSPRGGDLWVTLDEEKGVVRLKGNSKPFARGELTL